MILYLFCLLFGILLLFYSGSKLIDYAVVLAKHLKVTPALIGLVVISIGTSFPELCVSLLAGAQGEINLAIGNILGSNLCNVGLILGLCAMVSALPVGRQIVKTDYFFLLTATLLAGFSLYDGIYSVIDALFSFAWFLCFFFFSLRKSKRDFKNSELEHEVSEEYKHLKDLSAFTLCLYFFFSLIGLFAGSELLIYGGSHLARAFSISERVIGLSVVAIGTSLPELMATASAALKKQHEMAIANILGSNIFNIIFILPSLGLFGSHSIDAFFISRDLLALLISTVILFPILFIHQAQYHS